jgi:polar amino acid transport system ATP-binding protein
MLKITNLFKKYENHIVIRDINLNIKKNSITGLAGPSGGGKSTLLRILQKLEVQDCGKIISDFSSGFMFQDFQLFPHMNVLENLTYAPSLVDKKTNHETKAMKLLSNLGIKEKALFYPRCLSGGQKQRVALARSLMMSPKLLLCDEPTSGLDVATIDDVVSLLLSVRDLGVTIVIASHDLDFLCKIADRIIILKDGDIVKDLDPKLPENNIQNLKQYYS